MTDEIEETEKNILLLLGAKDSPLSELFIQKELFILSQVDESLKDIFYFKKHYRGPFSTIIDESLDSPLYYEDTILKIGEKIILTDHGKNEFKNMIKNEKIRLRFNILQFIRELYEKLNGDELLFLIYNTYPEFLEKSNVSNFLFEKENKIKILNSLLKKGIITIERYEELK